MSQLNAIEVNSCLDYSSLTALTAFNLAMARLKAVSKSAAEYSQIKQILSLAGFNQNGRNRITHLSAEEIDALCAHSPDKEELLLTYVNEIQLILSKMEQVRKKESFLSRPPFMGRPYVTIQLASAIGKLALLRNLIENNFEHMSTPELRLFMMDRCDDISRIEIDGGTQDGTPISIRLCIQLLELYSDELIKPPCLATKSNFDEFDLNMIETRNFGWMDDGGESCLEDIRDVPLVTHYDKMPFLDNVLDWFSATRPTFDHNQIKRGWAYVEKASEDWHRRVESGEILDFDITEYPSWNCIAADRQTELNGIFPTDNPYKIVPLITPQQLLDESNEMHHCVVYYIDNCISGETRIFSILDACNNKPVATAELSKHDGKWNLVQLKGKCNEELIQRMNVSSDLLATALGIFINWYNQNSLN